MELPELISQLSNLSAYPFVAHSVEVKQTHISVVFLAGEVVYKLKKPVNLGFLDFSTLEKAAATLRRRSAAQPQARTVGVSRRCADFHGKQRTARSSSRKAKCSSTP